MVRWDGLAGATRAALTRPAGMRHLLTNGSGGGGGSGRTCGQRAAPPAPHRSPPGLAQLQTHRPLGQTLQRGMASNDDASLYMPEQIFQAVLATAGGGGGQRRRRAPPTRAPLAGAGLNSSASSSASDFFFGMLPAGAPEARWQDLSKPPRRNFALSDPKLYCLHYLNEIESLKSR